MVTIMVVLSAAILKVELYYNFIVILDSCLLRQPLYCFRFRFRFDILLYGFVSHFRGIYVGMLVCRYVGLYDA